MDQPIPVKGCRIPGLAYLLLKLEWNKGKTKIKDTSVDEWSINQGALAITAGGWHPLKKEK